MVGKWNLIFSFLGRNKLLAAATIIAGILSNLFIILIPVSLGKYFDLLFGFNSHRAHVLDKLPFSFWNDVPSYMVFFFTLVALRTFLYFLQRFLTGIIGEKLSKEMRELLFEHQLNVDTNIYESTGTGKYLLRYSGDMKSIQNYITRGIIRFAIDCILLTISVVFLIWLDFKIFLIIGSGFLLTLAVIYFLNKRLYDISVIRRNTRSGVLAFVNSRITKALTIKAFNKQLPEVNKFNGRSTKLYEAGIGYQKIYNLIFAITPGLLYMTLGAVLYAVFIIKTQNGITFHAGEMLGFILLFITILPVFRRTVRVSTTWKVGNISFEKLIKVLNLKVEPANNTDYIYKGGKISIKNLSFIFPDNKMVFNQLNLSVKPGKLNIVVAPPGFGKSTLIKLLFGIYSPTKGVIKIDDQDLSLINLKSLRKKITVVSKGFPLLGNSVFEAISYSRKKEKKVIALNILNQLQQGLPENIQLTLEDKIGENGIKLSDGQIKMLLFARAVLTKKPIFLIDETLTGLHPVLQKNIINWIEKVQGSGKTAKTIIVFLNEQKENLFQTDSISFLSETNK